MKFKKKNNQTHPLTWRIRKDKKPIWIEEYCKKKGYKIAEEALNNMNSKEIILIIKNSELKGRGGGGFPTGIKWELMSKVNISKDKYIICNADEMEPGSYKDKLLIEQLPHLLIESIIIAAFALKAQQGYIFLRGEYIKANINLQKAIKEAINAGFIGNKIFNTKFNFKLNIHTGAGRYICGEETALLNSLEGKRAIPRHKPPFPALVGFLGKPTCINNVETLCNIPGIIKYGPEWYKGLSKSNDYGTKIMGFSGKVNNPGIWEMPFGTTAREILEKYAKGMCKKVKLKAWQPGGASTALLTEKHLDTPMDFTNILKIGSRLGTGVALAIDDKINILSLIKNIEKFFSRESCGWCTPCRDGLPWIVKILNKLEKKQGNKKDIKILRDLCSHIKNGTTFCAHAIGAITPLQSAMKIFYQEFKYSLK
ncbi:NADH-quinone oxidoreductase subunit NuoF [Candidatus Purcelliella pentastirinorum]|uniref:NADH-quinone oxidoreductase subunit NuoF n=1 Tax=Candidatus Purcelliella pentastirinorum TaxID=472834 RepID=UPI002367A52C|nr:NADH-quinone oxidoreductase subunit NuoF [Candidatus Purcelliella pentastirinorum]WDI78925.1 NADH-quinone oxidoreductase subunit NuoF [Candidatus Purcelliella pentastirinorum]WDR80059.1 NADH-quinone oxidoreductase subunit NuoF [Candidatus Purcelliella pentastirinorum]